MAGVTRRELLQAGAGAGVLALGANPLVRQALAKRPPATLSDVEHVVILIQENRSFDHYFGMLPGVRGFADMSVPRSRFEQQGYPEPGYGGVLPPFHPEEEGEVRGQRCFPDLTHSWVPQHESWDGGAMDAFVRTHLAFDGLEDGVTTMAYYERQDIPYYYALAENFTVCDNYYCPVLGPTYPNRLYAMSATIDPEGLNGGPLVETYEDFEFLQGRFTWTTMPEQLQAAGITWKSYTGAVEGEEDNVLEFFKNFQTNPELRKLGLEQVYPENFVADLRKGELPQVSWVNVSIMQTEHPGYSSAKVGEFVVESLLSKLYAHPRVWEKTAVFITWDENGGFFDHVAPPTPPPGTPGEYLTVPDITGNDGGITGPIGLGFRVPLLIVSPFARGGFLCSDTFDHTSLLRFLEARFGVEVPNLSQWRRENTGDLTSAFNFKEPKTGKGKLPKVSMTEGELEAGACADDSAEKPLTVPPPPIPFPEEPPRVWRRPSG